MTDIFGAVSTGLDIARLVGKHAQDVAESNEDLIMLENEIHNSCQALEKISKFLDSPENRSNPKFHDWISPLKDSKRQFDVQLDYIRENIEKIVNSNISPKYMWPLRQKKFDQKLVDLKQINMDLKRINEPFSQFVDVVQLESMQRLENDMKISRIEKMTKQGQKRFQDAISWLCSDSLMSAIDRKLENEMKKSQHSQPIWILGKEPYVHWTTDSSAKPKWLWGFGDAGAGKTCIASFLARELRKAPLLDEWVSVSISDIENVSLDSRSQPLDTRISLGSGSSVGIFYCDYKMEKEDQDPDTIVRCLCRQLLVQLESLDPNRCQEVLLLIEQFMHLATSATHITDVSQNIEPRHILAAIVSDLPRTYIIVDALDENTAGCKELLYLLENLQSASLRVFVTSRDGKDDALRHHAEDIGALQLQLCPEDKELRDYISGRLHQISNRHEKERTYGSALPTALANGFKIGEVADKIFEKAVGNFLCAELQIAGLKNCTTMIEFQNRLNKLPSTLEVLFQSAIERIEAQENPEARDIGKRTLLWVIYANKSLTVAELKQVLATYPLRKSRPGRLKIDGGPSTREIVESTRYFLNIYDATTTIQVHQAVREYCDDLQVKQRYFQNYHWEITRICLQYLTLENFQFGHCKSLEEWQERLHKNPLLEYAARNWGVHMGLIDDEEKFEEVQQKVLKLFRDKPFISCIGEALQHPLRDLFDLSNGKWAGTNIGDDPIIPALHIFVYFDLEETAEEWLYSGYETVDEKAVGGFTALYLACRIGRPNMVRLLLRHKADPTRENGNKRFCLASAAYQGYPEIVKQLLEHSSRNGTIERLLSIYNWLGRSVLADAALSSKKDIIDMLLNYAKTNTSDRGLQLLLHQDHDGYSALHEAARTDQPSMTRALTIFPGGKELLKLQTRRWKDFPLHTATVSAKRESIQTLLQLGAGIEAKQTQGKTALHLAAQLACSSHGKIVELLLNLGANPGTRDNDGKSALHCASDHGRPDHVRMLLKHGHKGLLACRDNWNHSPITAAAKGKHNDWAGVVEVLCTPEAASFEPKHDCEPHFNCLRSLRSETMSFTKENHDLIYLLSQRIPSNVKIHHIAFTIVSREQGDRDSFYGSGTWFDIAILRQDGLIHHTLLTRSGHAKKDFETFDMFWEAERVHSSAGSCPRDSESQEELINFLGTLQAGDRVAIIPKTNSGVVGLENIVAQAELTLFYPKGVE